MYDLATYFSCLIYLMFYCATTTGTYPVSRQADHQTSSSAFKSSPFAHNGTEQLYSEWSQWTKCSSTCGLGIITRTRTCLKRAYNTKGVYVPLCHAEYSEHKICHLNSCPYNAPEPREIQCTQHNNRTVAGKLVPVWMPASNSPNPCELRCKAKTDSLEYGFGKVSNGTPCPQGVCLDGRCLRIGCDDRIGSEVVLDMCGVCGGRNASCVHYKDVYMGQPPADFEKRNGYHEVVVLPVGARNIIIRQIVGKNYLALQDRTRGIILNGEHHLTKYGGHYDIAGTRIQFEKSDNTTEILTAKGPITEELYVLVLLRAFNQGIYYEYWLPKQTHNPTHNQYSLPRIESPASSTTTSPKSSSVALPSTNHKRHHPTKPAYAYGYGEKPYRSQDAPVFRHFTTTTTTTTPVPRPVQQPVAQQPHAEPQYRSNVNQPYSNSAFYKKNISPLYKPRTYVADGGFYQIYRNTSIVNAKKAIDLDKELPVLTQPDPGDRGRYDNIIPNSILDEKKHDAAKSQKPSRSRISISKRGDKATKYITNGRLKYTFESKDADGVYVNTSGRYTPEPLAIALLPLPESDNSKSDTGRKKGGDGRRKKPRLTRGGACEPCERKRDQTKHFCQSDFVIRGLVIGYEFLQGETRYEIDVKQTFKNTLSLLPKEYIWSPDTCRCPKLRPGKEYVIMGKIDNNYRKRESRLLVDKTCFVRTFNLKYARRLQKLRKDHTKKCTKTS